jgi:ACS family hexuronate transporter-like MFS transporter
MMGLTWRRWAVLGIFVLCTSVNFLDRQVFAAVAPTIEREFHLSGARYGMIVSAFALSYALGAPLAGWFVDRAGLNRSAGFAVGLWSLAGIATGFSGSLVGLLGCRMALGAGESAGMPGLAKANAIYLRPGEYALSMAGNNIAIAIGSSSAPLLVATMAPLFGWRSVFFVTGAAGLLWIPLWLLVARKTPVNRVPSPPRIHLREMLRDSRLWGLTASNALIMTVYTVWTNWTTLYFVQQLHLTEGDANRHYAWLPPIFATLGAFFGGWLAYRWIGGGMEIIAARLRGCRIAAVFILMTATMPLITSPTWAVIVISVTLFWAMSLQINVHILPVDIFGPERAGFSVSILACSYGLMQMLVSPVIGATVDRYGFSALCLVLSVLPLAGVWLLKTFLPIAAPPLAARRQHA